MSDATLTIPGLVFIGAEAASTRAAVIHLGPAVGWTIPRGVHTWSRELSVVMKRDVTPELQRELGLVLPEQQGDGEVVPRARLAAKACSLVAVDEPISDQLAAKGLRVHTIGFDRVSSGFFYLATGAGQPPKRVQGELIEIISPTLQTGAREELDARLDGLIDRLVTEISEGAVTEAQLELAEALPALGPKSDAAANKLQSLEGWLILQATRSEKNEPDARKMVETLRGAARRDAGVVAVAPFGNARRVDQPELEVEVVEGDAGKRGKLRLPARTRWLMVSGDGAAAQVAAPVAAAPKAAAVDQGAQRAAEERAAAERAAAQKAANAKAAAERAAAERATAERAAAERATAERSAVERAAAERAAAERAAAERAAIERAEAERFAQERAAAERAEAERAAAQRAAAERAAAENDARERAATDRASAERAQAEQAAKRAAASAAPAGRSAGPQSSRGTAPKSGRGALPQKEPFPFGLIFVMLVLGAMAGALLQYFHR